ncbi:PE-PGRS family protein [Nocardioides sp. JS614]|nr:PE-PGRS family protein [Nocardioides sp. JS614]
MKSHRPGTRFVGRPMKLAPGSEPSAPGQVRRAAALADVDVEDRLVAGVAGDGGLVGDQDAAADERRAAGGVEGDRRAVVAGERGAEPPHLLAGGGELDELVGQAGEGDVHVPRTPDAEPVGQVAGLRGPQRLDRAGAAGVVDRQPVERAVRGQVGAVADRLLGDQEVAAAGPVADAGGAELDRALERGRGEPPTGGARAVRHLPDRAVGVVGHEQRAAGAPGRVVRHRAVGEPHDPAEPAGPDVQGEHRGGGCLEQHQPAGAGLVGDLDPVVLVEVLAGHRPRPQQGAVRGPLEDPRGRRAARVDVAAGVDPAVGVGVDVRREPRRRHQREDPGVAGLAGRPGLRVGGRPGGRCEEAGRKEAGRKEAGREQRRQPRHRRSPTSIAARSPARTAPSM